MKTIMHLKNLSFIAILLAVYSCSNSKGGQAGMAGQVREYQVAKVQPQSTTLFKDYPTTLQGVQTVEIRPRIAGYIEEILVDEGDFVKKGQILFRINANDVQAQVRSAAAQVKVAEAQVSTANINVEKTKPLVDKNIVSQFELQSVETNLTAAEAQLAQAQANLANAKASLDYTIITSPTNGIIGNFPYRVGSLVSSSITQPLTTVSRTDNMYAYFAINERDFITMIRNLQGASTTEKLKQLPAVDLVLSDNSIYEQQGKIETASGIVDQETGSVNIRAIFPNTSGMLRSGTSGLVRIPQQMDSVLIIPQDVTFELQGRHFVYTVNSDSKVQSTPIGVIVGNLKDSYIVTSGLKTDDQIVIEGIASLRNDTQIKPKLVELPSLAENSDSVNPAKN
ncbi:efflux RND transporter periplasmic adaptor subunit [Mangrovibacterium lignilyticum]|uniref:efflux RND transporter periplasmic adaptor subunit n=1 Tax=Mangrovibacterium lignilyticum TaxID=2668052 RepID=UPI001966F54A|nr:efflux RND transporter periplasmic adaptor subunit [Mangrovibacterium lignilyticum]